MSVHRGQVIIPGGSPAGAEDPNAGAEEPNPEGNGETGDAGPADAAVSSRGSGALAHPALEHPPLPSQQVRWCSFSHAVQTAASSPRASPA
jgi:hypothetical protein